MRSSTDDISKADQSNDQEIAQKSQLSKLRKLISPSKGWEERKGSKDFYEDVDSLLFRAVKPLKDDPHSLNVHPRDSNNFEYRHIMIYGTISPYKYQRIMNKQLGIDEFEVVIDPETYRFRDVLKNHFKNIKEPIQPKDEFVIWSFYFLAGYILWVTLKHLGAWIRQPYLDERKRNADKVELKRIEEEKVNSEMVLKSRSPQAFYRYEFSEATSELKDRIDEIDRLLKDPDPLPRK